MIEEFLASAWEGPPALLLSGEPGIGKTILWEAGVDEAAARGYRVLTHRSVEAEAGLSFTGLADLLTPVLDDVLPAPAPRGDGGHSRWRCCWRSPARRHRIP